MNIITFARSYRDVLFSSLMVSPRYSFESRRQGSMTNNYLQRYRERKIQVSSDLTLSLSMKTRNKLLNKIMNIKENKIKTVL